MATCCNFFSALPKLNHKNTIKYYQTSFIGSWRGKLFQWSIFKYINICRVHDYIVHLICNNARKHWEWFLVNASCSRAFILCLYAVIIRSYEEAISFSEHVMSLLDMWAYVSGNNLTPGHLSCVNNSQLWPYLTSHRFKPQYFKLMSN